MKITKQYWAVYKVSGDSGVDGRGTFLFQTNSMKKIEELSGFLADMCDDRCNAKIIATNIHG